MCRYSSGALGSMELWTARVGSGATHSGHLRQRHPRPEGSCGGRVERPHAGVEPNGTFPERTDEQRIVGRSALLAAATTPPIRVDGGYRLSPCGRCSPMASRCSSVRDRGHCMLILVGRSGVGPERAADLAGVTQYPPPCRCSGGCRRSSHRPSRPGRGFRSTPRVHDHLGIAALRPGTGVAANSPMAFC